MRSIQDVVIEVDPGIDDAYALAILVAAQQIGIIRIVAVICSAGNAIRHQTCYNLIRIMTVLNASNEIPIFEGSYRPILRDQEFITCYGADGFGNMCIFKDPVVQIRKTEQFCEFIDKVAKPHSITLLVFAPLTFTCSFLMQNTNLVLKEIWIMGGNCIGECIAQSSFKRDPEAVDCVFQHANTPITLVTLQVCQAVTIDMHWRIYDLGTIRVPFIRFMNEVEKDILLFDRRRWVMNDGIMAAAFVFPYIIRSDEMRRITIGRNYPTDTSSGLLPDTDVTQRCNVRIINSLDAKEFQKHLKSSINGTIAQNCGRVHPFESNIITT